MRHLGLLAAIVSAFLALGSVAFAQAQGTQQFDTKAKFAILMDYETGTVLYDKDADQRLEPASMGKLITIAVVFDLLQQHKLNLTDEFLISEHAWKDGGAKTDGSTMFAKLGDSIKVQDLIRGVIIQSGNDAAIALAEGIAGTETTFANMQNKLAQEIGLTGSHFANATGLPDPDEYSTAHDLATIARFIIAQFPEYYPIFAEKEFTWNKIRQMNRNSLLEVGIGVDGLKTGHTDESGYGEVVSTAASGRRLIAVLHGMKTMAERKEEAQKLITWGMRGFELVPVYPEGKTVAYADVYGGSESSVPLVGKGNIDLFLPKGAANCPQATVTYHAPIRPPVKKGDQIGQLNVMCNNLVVQQTPLYAGKDIGDGDLVRKATDALKQLAFGWL